MHKKVHRRASALDTSTLIIDGAMFVFFVYSGLCAMYFVFSVSVVLQR